MKNRKPDEFDKYMRNLMSSGVGNTDDDFDRYMRNLMDMPIEDEDNPDAKMAPVELPESYKTGAGQAHMNDLDLFGQGSAGLSPVMRDTPPPVTKPVTPPVITPPVAEAGVKTPTPEPKPLPKGLITEGNLDLNKRPVVPRDDGKISTVNSITVGFDDGFYVLPTVTEEGLLLDNDQAVEYFKKTGKHLGRFYDQETADAFAQQLHLDQEKMYGGQGEAKYPGLFTELVEKFGNWTRENEAATPYVKGQEMGGPNTRVNLLDGIPEEKRDPLNLGKAISNIIPTYQRILGAEDFGNSKTMEFALQDAYAGKEAPLMSTSDVGLGLEDNLKLAQLQLAVKMGDMETASRLKAELEESIRNLAESSKVRKDWADRNRVQYDPAQEGILKYIQSGIENLGFSGMARLRSAPAWLLGGPVLGTMMSIYNATRESAGERGEKAMSILEENPNATREDLEPGMREVMGGNLGLLALSETLGDALLLGGLWPKIGGSKFLAGPGALKAAGRFAFNKALPYGSNLATEYPEEFGQELLQQLAGKGLGYSDMWKQADLAKAHEAGLHGIAGAALSGAGTMVARPFLDSARQSLSSRENENADAVPEPVGGAEEVVNYLKSLGIDVNLLDQFSAGQADAAPSQTPPTDDGGGGILETLVNNLKGTNPQMAQDVQDASGMLTPEQTSETAGILEQLAGAQRVAEDQRQKENQARVSDTVTPEKATKGLSDAYASGQVNDAQLDEAGGMLDTILGVPFGTTANNVRSGQAAPVAPAPATGEALSGEFVPATGTPAKAETPKLTRAQKIAGDLSNVQTRGDALEKVKGLKGKTLTEIANELGVEVSPNDTPATLRNKIIESTASENVGALAKRAQDDIRSRVERGETVVPPSGREAPAPAQTQTVPAQQGAPLPITQVKGARQDKVRSRTPSADGTYAEYTVMGNRDPLGRVELVDQNGKRQFFEENEIPSRFAPVFDGKLDTSDDGTRTGTTPVQSEGMKVGSRTIPVADATAPAQSVSDSVTIPGEKKTPVKNTVESATQSLSSAKTQEEAESSMSGLNWKQVQKIGKGLGVELAKGQTLGEAKTAVATAALGNNQSGQSQQTETLPVQTVAQPVAQNRQAEPAPVAQPVAQQEAQSQTPRSPVVESLGNAKSREDGAEILKGLKKVDLLGVAKELGLPVRKSDTVNSLRDAIVEDTVGSRLRSDAFRTSDLRSENEKLGETKEEKTETEKPTPKYRVTEDGRDTSKLTEFEDEVQDQEAKSEPVQEQSKPEPAKEESKPEPAKENTKTEDGSPSAETVDLNKKITFRYLKKAFPKERVENLGNGIFRVKMRNGKTVYVTLSKKIDINEDSFKREYGRNLTEAEKRSGAAGSTTRLVDGNALVQIAADMTMTEENLDNAFYYPTGRDGKMQKTTRTIESRRTLFHEVFHTASDMVLSEKEKSILRREIGNEEAQANYYMDWVGKREDKSLVGRIFQRMFDFFSDIKAGILGPNAESIFRGIYKGKTFAREANEVASDSGKAGPSYRVKADPAAYEASMADLKNSVSLASVMKTAGSQKWGTNVDFMYALEKEIGPKLEAVGIDYDSTYDKKDTDPAYQKLKAYLVDVATADALEAIQTNKNAIGWYDEKTSQALAIMSTIYPELATDPNAKFAFTVALAVTSNGQKVNKNFELARKAYEEYKRTGKMPTDIGIGTTKGSIDQGLKVFNTLVDKYGIDDTRRILTTRFTVGQLKSIGIEVKGELVDQWVIGGATLGPKVGNGFFANLNRFFDALTMDRWFMRSWGRWTGKLFSTDQSKQMGSEARLGRSVSDILSKIEADVKADIESGKFKLSGNTEKARDKSFLEEVRRRSNEFLSSVIGPKRARNIDLISVKEEIDSNEGKERKYHKTELSHNLAKAIKGASVKKEARNAMRDSYGGDEFRKAGNNLAGSIDEEKQAPDNGSERKFIRDVFTDVLANLKDQGYNDLTMADLQAVLWYAEKKVYESAKAKEVSESYEDDEAPDYANAAEKLAQSLGVPQEEIARAKEEAKNVNSTADAGGSNRGNDRENGKGDRGGKGTAQTTPEGFLERERKKFLKRHIFSKERLRLVRSQKAKGSGGTGDGSSWVHKRRSNRGDREVRGLEIQATYTPTATLEKILNLSEISHPTVHELTNSPENAKAFREAITEAKNSDLEFGAAVYVYDQSVYEGMRLFLTDDGKHGFAIKGDGDIVSVFSAKNKDKKKFDAKDRDTWSGVANWFLTVATSEGGTKLDCYDTILPEIYKLNGFREVRRDKWDESQVLPDWNKETFKKYNNGEPDVVYMEYDPTYDPFAEQDEQSTTKYRISDREYLSAVEAGDLKTAQRMVDDAAREAGFTYHRYTTGLPAVRVPWMMFTSDQQSVENAYGDRHYVASDQGAIDIEELIPDITEALEEYGSTEFIRDNAEAIADELNPDEIVTSAGSWDDAEVVQDVWDRVLEDRGIFKVKTADGLMVMADQDYDGNGLVKSADPIVKDDQGNVIPLSKRFDSKESDVRYRVSTADTLDAEYLAAVEAGDLKTAQRMVDEAAKEAGYGIGPVYHGTNAKFNTFRRGDIGFHFGTKSQARSKSGYGKDAVVISANLNIQNPLRISTDYGSWDADYAAQWMLTDGHITQDEYREIMGAPYHKQNKTMVEVLIRKGYDGIEYMNHYEGRTLKPSYIVFSSSQVKRTDPITRDHTGNVIPLSERFNSKKSDIRYRVAYHGSPYEFTSFSKEHINTGEGYQMYGWGLYFAEEKKVADTYRKQLAEKRSVTVDGKPIMSLRDAMPDYTFFQVKIIHLLKKEQGDVDRTIKRFEEDLRSLGDDAGKIDRIGHVQSIEFLESLRGHTVEIGDGIGQLYEVNIPEEDVFLDLDATFDDQPWYVHEAIRENGIISLKSLENEMRKELQEIMDENSLVEYDALLEMQKRINSAGEDGDLSEEEMERYGQKERILISWFEEGSEGRGYALTRTGWEIYSELADYMGGPKEASEHLNSLGIKGLRYLDAGSRSDGDGTRNFVIFDDKVIDMVKTHYRVAYHGSPHRFTEFSTEYIGTGERAQAFGWGLYFTERQGIADDYREKLQKRDFTHAIRTDFGVARRDDAGNWDFVGEDNIDDPVWVTDPHEELAYEFMMENNFNEKRALRKIDEFLKDPKEPTGTILDHVSERELDLVKGMKDFIETTAMKKTEPGQLYEVEIPDDDSLLYWDKPLREQPETVRDAVKKALESVPDQDYLRVVTSLHVFSKSYILPSEGYDADKLDGQEIYMLLGTVLHGDKEASKLLGSHGIKGIKYLDGNSRWRGEGTHNFVVFNDEAIKVVKTHYRMRPGMVESKTPVTGDDLKRSVPGAKIFDMGKIPVMKLRNGKYLAVDPTGEIPMGMDVSIAEIGEDVNTGSIASNSVMAIDGNHFLTLIDGMTRGSEIPEGLYEIGRSSALSVEQYNKLDQLIGAPAPQAGMYREFLATGKTPNGEITKIFNSIKDFYSTIKTKIFGRRGSAVFDRIGSREGGYQGGTKYRVGGATQSQQWKQAVAGLNMEEVVEPTRTSQTLKDKMHAAWRWWKREVTDDISGIRDYFGKDIYIKATNAIHGINSRAEGLIRFGEKAKGVKSLSDIFSRVPENEQDGFMHFVVYTHMLDIARNTENAMAAANQLDVLAKEEMDKARAFLKTVPADQSELTTLRRNARIHEEIADEYRRQAEEARKQIHETRAKADDYQMAVDNLRKAYPHWEQAQMDLTKFNRFLLWKLKKAGIISSSLHDTLVTRYPNYVPLQRDFGEEAGFESFVRTGGIVNLANPLKKLKGSSRDVKDPLLQIISNVYAFEGLLGKQEAGHDIASMADNGQLAGLVDPIAESDRTGLPGEYVFHVWENGKKKYYKTDQDIYTALVMSSKDAGTGGFATLLKVLSIPVRVLRAGVTHGVGFILRNPMRDTVNAGMVGDHFTPIMTTLKGAFSILSKKDGWFEEFVKSGASQGVAYLSPKTKAELARSIRMGTGKTRILNELKNPPRALWRLLGEMAQFTELATRVGQYRVSRERGADMGKAAYEARDLLNYQRGGRVSRAISKVNPFFNAQIQGVAKGLRSMYHDGKVDAKSLARGMLYITLPSMLVTLWNYGDDDRRKKYLSIPAWQRNLFWNIVVGEGDDAWILKLPKPFDLGLLFGSIPERAMDYLYADDKKAFDDLGKSVLDAVSPEWGPLFMTLPLELATNYSFFRGGNIVPMSQERLDPRLQYGPYTAEWAKWAGDRFGLSPRKLEYVVNNITGNLGKEVSDLTDKVFRAMSGETRPAREWYQEVPGVSAFAVPAKAMKRWEQTFRDERDELDTILRSAKEVMETKGRKSLSRDERRALGAENAIKRVNQHFTGKGGINELQREINKITVAKNLSSEEKRRRVDRLQKRIAQITERGLRDTARIKNSLKKP